MLFRSEEFDIKNSRFLEDESRDFAKPNPEPLIKTINGLKSSCSVFVGDSMEDYIMSRKADQMGKIGRASCRERV